MGGRLPAFRPEKRVVAVRGVVALREASHPDAVLAVTAVMIVLALSAGRGASGAAAVGAAVLVGQLSVGWSNDYIDVERDRRAGRRDKPVAQGTAPRRLAGAAALTALLLVTPLSLLSGWRAAVAHVIGVLAAWGYNLRLKATPWSVVPYLIAFGLLPGLVVWGLPGHPTPPVWLMVGGALLGAGAHFANVLPDLEDDAAAGVRGLPQRLGRRGSEAASAVLLLAASVVVGAFSDAFPTAVVASVVTAEGLVLGSAFAWGQAHPTSRLPFRTALVIAAADVLLLVSAGSALR